MKRDYKYDIFISYKHEKLDKAVAAKLQKKLENYKIPKEIKVKTGKEKIQRVFRDEEELSISSDLGREIEDQLKQSEYLLLVCSKKTKESPWVLREIETFLKYRDVDHILPVLVDGEPEESFPEILLQYGEPLAADIREKDEKSVIRKANKELPRILAPVLHCSYDELKQRHKVQKTNQLLGIASIVVCVAVAFTSYALFQAQRLKKENQATRKNQARYLCNVSDSLLKAGDRIGALQTAMAILPEDEKAKEPVVPEQINALNNALYSYKHDDLIYFRSERMQELKGKIEGNVQFSDQGTYCVAVDDNRTAYCFDGKTGKLRWKTGSKALTDENEGIYSITPIDEERAVLITRTKIVIVNIDSGDVSRIFTSHFSETDNAINAFAIKDKVVLWTDHTISVLELKYGEQVADIELKNIEQVIVDQSGKKLFIAVGGELKNKGNSLIYSEKDKEDAAGIYSYTLKNKKLDRVSKRATEKISLIDDEHIAAVQYTEYKYKSIFISDVSYSLAVYDMKNNKRVWEQNGLRENDLNAQAGCQAVKVKITKKKNKHIVLFYFKNTVYCLDVNGYKMISQKTYDSQIAGIEQYDNTRLLVALESGSIYRYMGYSEENDYSKWADSEMNAGGIESDFVADSFSYNMKNQTAIEYGDEKIVFLRILQDDEVKVLNKEDSLSKVFYITVKEDEKNTVYRCMSFNEYDSTKIHKVAIYKSGTKRPIYTIQASDKKRMITNVTLGLKDGELVVCYSVDPDLSVSFVSDNITPKFYMVDLQTKQIINSCEFSQVDHATNGRIFYADDLSCAWLYNNEQVWQISLTPYKMKVKEEKQWTLKDTNWQLTRYIEELKATTDGKYIIFMYNQNSKGTLEYYLKIWDRENSNWEKIEGKEKITNLKNENAVAIGRKNNVIAVEKKNGKIVLINLDTGSIENTITSYQENETVEVNNSDIAFFNNDEYLIKVRRTEGYLNVIDTKTGEVLAEAKDKLIGTNIIVDDDSKYFGIKDTFIGREKNSVLTKKLTIYMLEPQSQVLVKCADVDYGWISFEGKEVIGGLSEGSSVDLTYYTDFYDFSQLRKEAEKLLKGEKLTKKDRRKYFLEN